MSRLIAIAEVFGPVIQGEGAQAGRPTLFIRTGGCDYRCTWCDTMFAVDPGNSSAWERLTAEDIMGRVADLTNAMPAGVDNQMPLITLSGGNPAMWDLGELVSLLKRKGYPVAIETQGTVWPAWAYELDFITLSPKPPSSGMVCNREQLTQWLHALAPRYTSLKVVVANDVDLEFALSVAELAPDVRLYVQPCNPYAEADSGAGLSVSERVVLLDEYRALCEMVLARGLTDITVLPQLHVLANGGGRGR